MSGTPLVVRRRARADRLRYSLEHALAYLEQGRDDEARLVLQATLDGDNGELPR